VKKNLLIVSRFAPYKSVPHAGGKTHYFYLKKFNADPDFNVKLVTFLDVTEKKRFDLASDSIDFDVSMLHEFDKKFWLYLFFNLRNGFNYFGKTFGMINGYVHREAAKKLRALKKKGYRPDVIILEWTQIVLTAPVVRTIFPRAVLVASEHDVSYIGLQRKLGYARGLRKLFSPLRFAALKKSELAALRCVDLIAPHNPADAARLRSEGINAASIHPIAPFYTDYSAVAYNPQAKNILFFGAMDRFENWGSVIWFIENVFDAIRDTGAIFYILGGKPAPALERFRSDRVKITGFVDDIIPYIQSCKCMVAPLLAGAGIKVKILEMMSAGLPLLTNGIGIEGIPAVDKEHYFHCEKSDDYIAALRDIFSKTAESRLGAMSAACRRFIYETYRLDASYDAYKSRIVSAMEKKCG
jgi:glycosyltransferase involved in cell wall biosynthesis